MPIFDFLYRISSIFHVLCTVHKPNLISTVMMFRFVCTGSFTGMYTFGMYLKKLK